MLDRRGAVHAGDGAGVALPGGRGVVGRDSRVRPLHARARCRARRRVADRAQQRHSGAPAQGVHASRRAQRRGPHARASVAAVDDRVPPHQSERRQLRNPRHVRSPLLPQRPDLLQSRVEGARDSAPHPPSLAGRPSLPRPLREPRGQLVRDGARGPDGLSPRGKLAMYKRPLRLLVVDDSAVMRQAMIAICRRVLDIEVRVAADPLIAQAKMRESRPDVILLDIEMPRMDGLTFLRKLMADDPLPVVICSALAGRGTETALRALEEGAVEIVAKPRIALHDFLTDSTEMFIDVIRAAAKARTPRRMRIEKRHSPDVILPPARPRLMRTTRKVVAIGASTGGTEALREILEALPPDAPGMVIVQHMPEVFTAAFAQRLNQTCRVSVKEAAEGDRVIDGRALIAPGNRHVLVVRDGAEYRVHLNDGPFVSRHKPSVDVLFRSVAQSAGPNAVGVILTGMGDDGATGLSEMRAAGAATIAQDEATCAVFGMPREAIARGGVQAVHPLGKIAATILATNYSSSNS